MSARSLATAALLAVSLSTLPSAGFADPLKNSSATVGSAHSAFQIPGAVELPTFVSDRQSFDASSPATQETSMIPWIRLMCVGVPMSGVYCWLEIYEL